MAQRKVEFTGLETLDKEEIQTLQGIVVTHNTTLTRLTCPDNTLHDGLSLKKLNNLISMLKKEFSFGKISKWITFILSYENPRLSADWSEP